MDRVRRTKGRFGPLFACLVVLATLGGCLEYDETIEGRPDGSGTITFHYKMPVLLVGFAGRSNPDAIVPLSFDAHELRELLLGAGLRPSTLEVFDRDAERHVRLTLDLASLEDLKRLPRIRGHAFEFETDAASGDWIFHRTIRLDSAKDLTSFVSRAALELAKLRFTCRLPWPIRHSNADGERAGELRWARRLSELAAEPFVMTVRLAPPSLVAWVALHPVTLGALGVVMLGGAGLLAVRRRRRTARASALITPIGRIEEN